MGKLTDVKIRQLRLPGRYGDGMGLYLNVAAGGSKSWVQRIVIDGRRRDLGLGGYPTITLAKAREQAIINRRMVSEGQPPASKRRNGRRDVTASTTSDPATPTFREAAAAWHVQHSQKWRSEKTRLNWWQRAERYVFPVIGGMPLQHIRRDEVFAILDPIWTEKPETARQVRSIVRRVLGWSRSRGDLEVNPAGELIDEALPTMPTSSSHFQSLNSYEQVGAALETVETGTSMPTTKLAFRFLVLTAARSGEVRGATWSEMDLGKAVWRIPPERMKNGKEHLVPLSRQAQEVLRQVNEMRHCSGLYVFPNDLTPEKRLSENAFSFMLRRLGVPSTAHGFRSSFRGWAEENTTATYAVKELSLSHEVGGKVERSYLLIDLLRQRSELMQQWADYIDETRGYSSLPAWATPRRIQPSEPESRTQTPVLLQAYPPVGAS